MNALNVSIPSGPLCEQHLGVWEDDVSHQPLCPVLLPARVHSDTDRYSAGPTTGLSLTPRGSDALRSSAGAAGGGGVYFICFQMHSNHIHTV